MFEIGSDYRIVTLEHSENHEGKWGYYENSIVSEVAAVDGTSIKLLGPDYAVMDEIYLPPGFDRTTPRTVTILNTACLIFVRAEKII